ncbi:hypothetical protein E4U55_008256 [Claviceps digitariae]|nr:hypothetical protein E4U55_008256 [Claviceps digitariae]
MRGTQALRMFRPTARMMRPVPASPSVPPVIRATENSLWTKTFDLPDRDLRAMLKITKDELLVNYTHEGFDFLGLRVTK